MTYQQLLHFSFIFGTLNLKKIRQIILKIFINRNSWDTNWISNSRLLPESQVLTYYLTGPYGPCQVKRYSLRSQQFCLHILCVEQSEGTFVWMFYDLVCVALCVIAKYKTTLYKFNWLKDKLPCLDSSASPADQAHHAVRAVRVKICVKTSCPR